MQEQSARDAGDAVEVSASRHVLQTVRTIKVWRRWKTAASGAEIDAGDARWCWKMACQELTMAAPDDLDDLFDAGDDSLKAGSGR